MARPHEGERIPITLRIPIALNQALYDKATATGTTRHALILELITLALGRRKKREKAD